MNGYFSCLVLVLCGVLACHGNPVDLTKYARAHEGTVTIEAYGGRYDPGAWPAWYQRTLYNGGGHYKLAYARGPDGQVAGSIPASAGSGYADGH